MYKCSNCGATMSQPLDRCPSCKVLLSGIKCEACGYIGGKSEFIKNNHRCPECQIIAHIPGVPRPAQEQDEYKKLKSRKIFRSLFGLVFIGVGGLVLLLVLFIGVASTTSGNSVDLEIILTLGTALVIGVLLAGGGLLTFRSAQRMKLDPEKVDALRP